MRSGRRSALVVVVAALGSCTPHTRAPENLPPLVAAPGAVQIYAVGDVADCRRDSPERTVARRTAALVPTGATVLALGDLVYPLADTTTLERCYEPTWGQHRARTLAVAGNHDYVEGSARDFRAYFGLDAIAASERFVAYTRELAPAWVLIVLDSNVAGDVGREQQAWFEQTLERVRPDAPTSGSASSPCIAVAWHTPLHSSGWHRGSGEHMRAYWDLAEDHRVDLLLSGHEHFYEAFEPMDARGRPQADGAGIRQFTVGTGGAWLYGFWRPPYRSRARVLDFGVLQLTLEPGRYAWRFIDVEGKVRDAGSAACRGPARPIGVPPAAELG